MGQSFTGLVRRLGTAADAPVAAGKQGVLRVAEKGLVERLFHQGVKPAVNLAMDRFGQILTQSSLVPHCLKHRRLDRVTPGFEVLAAPLWCCV